MTLPISWLRDHGVWTLPSMTLTLVLSLTLGDSRIINPLGDYYADPRLGMMLVLVSSVAMVIGLQSRVANQLQITAPARCRAAWWLFLLGLHLITIIGVSTRAEDVGYIGALTFFVPTCLTLLRPWLGLIYVFALFIAVVLTPSSSSPSAWPMFDLIAADTAGIAPIMLGIAAFTAYVSNAGGQRRY